MSLRVLHTSWPLPLNCLAKRSGKLQNTSESASLSYKHPSPRHEGKCNSYGSAYETAHSCCVGKIAQG